MKIALLGYGKMGKAIAELAKDRGHSIAVTIDNEQEWEQHGSMLAGCDVAIDFTTPSTAVENIYRCFGLDVPVVVGTTGWYDAYDSLCDYCRKEGKALFTATNFSIGMNVVFELNRRLAQMMNRYPEYNASITETHHIHKLDSPSGTAITLASDAVALLDRMDGWHEQGRGPVSRSLPVASIREGEVAGIHEVVYDSEIDTLTLIHQAKSRKGLALGAVLAAEFLCGKRGCFTMKDMLSGQ